MRSQKMCGRGITGQVCVVWAAFFALMLMPGGHAALHGGAVHAETLPETMSEAGVLEFLTAHSITTVEGFVAALPPLHKRNFLAVFDSESPSAAFISAAHPRIVSWGADARFIVTWTTNPADPAADQVEFLRPVPTEGEWSAGALDFTGERPQLVRSPSSGRTACSQCHSALNRPVWGNDNLGEGTENEVQTVESQPTHCTLATTMLTTADRRLTPLEREGYRSSPRRSIAFPGRGGQAPNWEFGTTLGLRHAEVLFTRLKARSDYAAVAEARMCNTQTAASLFSKEEYDLSLLSTAGTHVQGAPVTTPAQAGEYVGGSVRLGGALDFLILYDLYQSREAVQQLYRTTSNREMFLEGVTASLRLDFLRYAEGAATAEAELRALYTENFELQGQAYLAERARRGVNPRYSGSVLSHHAGDFRGKVCSRLGGGEEERQSGVRDAGSFGEESSFGDAGSFGDESGVRDASGSEAGRCSFGEETRSEDALVAAGPPVPIAIVTLAQLDAIRHDMDGDGVPTAAGAAAYRKAFADAAADPLLICNISSRCAGYQLGKDLDFDTNRSGGPDAEDAYWNAGAGWDPIGSSLDVSFYADFDGNGHTIHNLFIHRPDAHEVGLFGAFHARRIRRVGLVAVDVTGKIRVGGLVGVSGGRVTDSFVTGRVTGRDMVGGLIGYNSPQGDVHSSYAAVQVTGEIKVGGLVGDSSGRVTDSFVTGRATGRNVVGGLVGINAGAITTSYATGSVLASSTAYGDLVGKDSGLRSHVAASYFDTSTSGDSDGEGRTTAQLQAPTSASGIYADWSTAAWNFGTAGQYPALQADMDGDGQARWQEFGYQVRAGPQVTATATGGAVEVRWTGVVTDHWRQAPAVRYAVYRTAGPVRELELLAAEVAGPPYTDRAVEPGVSYRYQVAAVVNGGEAARSALVEVAAPGAITPVVTPPVVTPPGGGTGEGGTGEGGTGEGGTGEGGTGGGSTGGGTGGGGGTGDDGTGGGPVTLPPGYLENPGANSSQSGLGLISGWVCAADLVEIEMGDFLPQAAAYGTERLDTAGVCGDTDNGFGLLFNWNLLDDGEHTVVAYVDGVELGRATVTVTTLGAEFLREAEGECVVEDFPAMGQTVTLEWQQTSQNFVIAGGSAPARANTGTRPSGLTGYLENPGLNSFQSGVGVISGWVCEADTVELAIGTGRQAAAYGTERLDTEEACGDTDNGFGLLFNWNLLGDGEHTVVAYVDEEELGRATVRVTTLGQEFLRGAEGECVVEDFPRSGQNVLLEWQQNSQNFVVTDVE